jgi:tRNA G26 N,N-dimethylase Trm1
LQQFLKENEQKRLTGLSKQQKKKIDMYETLLEEGYNVSYTLYSAQCIKKSLYSFLEIFFAYFLI